MQLLHGLSRAPDLDTPDTAACSEFLASVLARYPQYTGLLTITPQGDLHCDSLRSGRKLNVAQRDYFKQARPTQRARFRRGIRRAHRESRCCRWPIPCSTGAGALKYVLLASFNLSKYAQAVAAASEHPDGKVLIWNRNGMLMARKPDADGAQLAGKRFAESELFRFAAGGESRHARPNCPAWTG